MRDEALRALPEPLRADPVVFDALFSALSDPSSKIRSFAFASLAKARGEEVTRRLQESLDAELTAQLEPVELCKLYATAGLAGVGLEVFSERLNGRLGRGRGKQSRAAAMVGLACAASHAASPPSEVVSLLSKEAGRLMASAHDKEAARWGEAFLSASPTKRAELTSSLLFRGLLTP